MHEVDIIEDAIISYGYNKIEPEMPQIAGNGNITEINSLSSKIAEIMVGAGGEEIMSYMLTNYDILGSMGIQETAMELENPVSKTRCVFRTWLLPCLMDFLSHNTNKAYPQNIFEIGEVVIPDNKAETRSQNPTKLAWAYAGGDANFTKAKQHIDFFMDCIGLNYEIEETEHPSFIPGRSAKITVKGKDVAIIGEIRPDILEKFRLEQPVCAFEMDISNLLGILKN